MSTELIINATLPETRIALLENNEIEELHIERDSERGIVGNIYKGRVIRVLPGMQAAFVDIGLEKAAFLYVDDIFFPDMKTPLQTQPLPEALATQPTAGRQIVLPSPVGLPGVVSVQPVVPGSVPAAPAARSERGGRGGRGRGGRDRAPRVEAAPLPGTPEAHAAAQAEYARQLAEGHAPAHAEETDKLAPPPNVAPLASPLAASADPAHGHAAGADQPVARAPIDAPPAAFPAAFDEDEDDDGEIESQAVYRPEPLIDAAAWEEDLSDESDEPEESAAVAGAAAGETVVPGRAEGHAEVQQPAAAVTEASAAPLAEGVEAAPRAVEPVVAKVAPVVTPTVRPVGPVGVDEDDDEDEETSELPRRRRRREPVNIADIIKEGQEIVVQVAKDPIGTKGARLTCHVSLPGRYLVFMPTVDHIGVSRRIEGEGERRRLKETMGRIRPARTGVIVRTASGKQTDRQLKQDLDYLVTTWNDIQKKFVKQRPGTTVYQDMTIVLRAIRDMFTDEVDKVVVDSKREYRAIMKFVTRFIPQVKDKVELYEGDSPIFDRYGIEMEITKALDRKVWLKSGGYLVVDQTEALVAIDVNTGRYVGKKTLEETILKTNLEAVKEIAYQLRLRNCGGIIILDLIDMEKEANKEKVYKALEEALKKDRARPSILKISSLGLLEMTRKRTRDSMVRSLCEPCVNCEGKGFVKNKLTLAYDIMRDIEREISVKENTALSIQCHPSVADVLLEDKRDVLEDMEHQYDKKLTVRGNGAYHVEQYELVAHRETKNIVWSSEERRQILKSRSQERAQQLAAESRKHTEAERIEKRKIDDERRREQEKIRADKRALAEEQRRQAAAVREAARIAAMAAALGAAEEQVRIRLTEQGLTALSPEWTEQFASGVSAIMTVFNSQQLPILAPEPYPDDDEDGLGADVNEAGQEGGDDRSRRRNSGNRDSNRDGNSSRRRRGRRGRSASAGGGGGNSGGGQQRGRGDHRPDRSGESRPERGSGGELPVPNGPGGVPVVTPVVRVAGAVQGAGSGSDDSDSREMSAGAGPEGPGAEGKIAEGDPQRRRRRRGRRGGRWRRRPGGPEGSGGAPGGEGGPGGGGGGESSASSYRGGSGGASDGGGESRAPVVAAPNRGDGGGSSENS